MSETLRGTIERVTFFNEDNGFAVLKVKASGQRDLVTVTGNVSSVSAGEELDASGRWVVDPEHGPQFRAEHMSTSHPASRNGIERYLSSGAVRNRPEDGCQDRGDLPRRALEIIESYSDMLLHIRGIGRARLQRIRESWQEQKEVRQIMLFLHELGVGSGSRAVRIYKTYGRDAIAVIRTNPFQLADDVRGIGFKTADQLAARLGIDPQSLTRAQAAVRFMLQQLSREGHCAFPESGVIEKTQQLLGVRDDILRQAVEIELESGLVVRELIDTERWLYLASLHRAEIGVAEQVCRLASCPSHPLPQIDVNAAIAWVENRLAIDLAENQRGGNPPGEQAPAGRHHGRAGSGEDHVGQEHPRDLRREEAGLRPGRAHRTSRETVGRNHRAHCQDRASAPGVRSGHRGFQTQPETAAARRPVRAG